MSRRCSNGSEKRKAKFVGLLFSIFVLSILAYFLLDGNVWGHQLFPNFIGVSWTAIMLLYAFKPKMDMRAFIVVNCIILGGAIVGFIFGYVNKIPFLYEVMPNFIAGTTLTLILAIVFKKKIIR